MLKITMLWVIMQKAKDIFQQTMVVHVLPWAQISYM